MVKNQKLRAVLDSNVLVSALAFKGVPMQVVQNVFIKKFQPLTSIFIAEEVKRTLTDKLGLGRAEAEFLLDTYESVAEIILPEDIEPTSRDPKDDPILAVAIAGEADYVVTGDNDLLILKEFQGIKIISPAEFLKVFSSKGK